MDSFLMNMHFTTHEGSWLYTNANTGDVVLPAVQVIVWPPCGFDLTPYHALTAPFKRGYR